MALLFGFVSLRPVRERKGAVGWVEKGPNQPDFSASAELKNPGRKVLFASFFYKEKA